MPLQPVQFNGSFENMEGTTVMVGSFHLTLKRLLGRGGFATVWLTHSPSGDSYALKVTKELSENDHRRVREEISFLEALQGSQNIVHLYAAGILGATVQNCRAFLVMERCVNSTLQHVVNRGGVTQPEFLWIAQQLLLALTAVHDAGIIHRDIKLQNLLFDLHGRLKLSDFGLAGRLSGASRRTVAGTMMYMAPEMAKHYLEVSSPRTPYGQGVDLWSAGIVLFVLLIRRSPYNLKVDPSIAPAEKQRLMCTAAANGRIQWPQNLPETESSQLVKALLTANPQERPSLRELLQRPLWKARPVAAPIVLMQKLHLLQQPRLSQSREESLVTGFQRAASSELRTPSPPNYETRAPSLRRQSSLQQRPSVTTPMSVRKRHIDDYAADILVEIQKGEALDRTQLVRSRNVGIFALLDKFNFFLEELADRRRLCVEEENFRLALRGDIGSAMWRLTSKLVAERKEERAESVSLLERTETTGDSLRPTPSKAEQLSDSALQWAMRNSAVLSTEETPKEPLDNRQIQPQAKAFLEGTKLCLNGHVMQQLRKLPGGIVAFDCNLCDRGVITFTPTNFVYRCRRCDFDVCNRCVETVASLDAPHICSLCGKRFITRERVRPHERMCRGPSQTPLRRRESERLSLLYDKVERVRSASRGRDLSDFPPIPEKTELKATAVEKRRSPRLTRGPRVATPIRLSGTKRPRSPSLSSSHQKRQRRPEVNKRRSSPRRSTVIPKPPPPKPGTPLHQQRTVSPARPRASSLQPPPRLSSSSLVSHFVQKPSPPKPARPLRDPGTSGTVHRAPVTGASPSAPLPTAPAIHVLAQHQQQRRAASAAASLARPPRFLALPRSGNPNEFRSDFLESFLRGSWVRHYVFATEGLALMFYSLQPGRFGALYPVDGSLKSGGGFATVVVDIPSQVVLHVPFFSEDSAERREALPHVQTYYNDPLSILSLAEATKLPSLKQIVSEVLAYVQDMSRILREQMAPAYIPSAYVFEPERTAVSSSVKFAYIRKVFPDPQQSFAMFRLSNLRTHIICTTAAMDIRWQADRRNRLTLKYYVFSDGTLKPFDQDHSGICERIQFVLASVFDSTAAARNG